MKKRFLQATSMTVLFKGFIYWILKIFVGIQYADCSFLKKEKQFILIANHNSHLDTLSLMSSLPSELLPKVKPVAAEDYFGNTKLKAALSNYFFNTLLINRKGNTGKENSALDKMLQALDDGYSLLLFPEGTRGEPEQMGKLKSGIARLLVQRPNIKYVPVFLAGMGRSLPKGEMIILPYNANMHFGEPSVACSSDPHEVMEQIENEFHTMMEKFRIKDDDEEDEEE
ncbi:MAG: 1-acyl-sn-glycerol-3-phosphate acyltransferase [Paludibacteraceae bacterium]|nr:1-acyl-sn-glycerol-3-phosphate acyltransferase [Paludibacteraceae bacterium]